MSRNRQEVAQELQRLAENLANKPEMSKQDLLIVGVALKAARSIEAEKTGPEEKEVKPGRGQ